MFLAQIILEIFLLHLNPPKVFLTFGVHLKFENLVSLSLIKLGPLISMNFGSLESEKMTFISLTYPTEHKWHRNKLWFVPVGIDSRTYGLPLWCFHFNKDHFPNLILSWLRTMLLVADTFAFVWSNRESIPR